MNLIDYLEIGSAAVAGGAAIYQYATGGWPFMEFPKYGFYIVESWRERIATPKEGPNTHPLIRPFYRLKLDEKGEPIFVSKGVKEEEIKDLKFLSKRNYQGTMTLEYRWFVDTPEGANDFYFRADADPDQVDNFIRTEISHLLGRMNPEDLGEKQKELSQGLYLYFDGGEGEKGLLYEKTGVHLDSLSISEIHWNKDSWDLLQVEEKAKKEVKQQEIQAGAAVARWNAIRKKIKKTYEEEGSSISDEELDEKNKMFYKDQTLFEFMQEPGNTVLFPYDMNQPIIPIQPRNPQGPTPSPNSPQEPQTPEGPNNSNGENPKNDLGSILRNAIKD